VLVGKVVVGLLGLGLVIWLLCEETRGVHFGRASVTGPAAVKVHGTQMMLWGVRQPRVDATCKAGVRRWSCGAYGASALILSVSNRRVMCFERGVAPDGARAARCYASSNFFNWKDVGRELVRKGWAMPDLQVSREYLPSAAEAEGTGAGLWISDLETGNPREME
jgi:endonuclease YncB( thermonuclease family)